MKVAFTASEDSVRGPLDSRFGRAPKFLVYDADQNEFELINNAHNLNAAQGAGIQAAEMLVRAGVDSLVTAHCGPKAFRVLAEAGIKVFLSDSTTIADALQAYKSGSLEAPQAPDVNGHWS
jgi:predicted Fe-Mo cluster-binding NifX family protein